MDAKERARHAALVRWGKKNPLAARVAALREKRKAKGGGAAPKAPKPDKAAATAANLAAAGDALMEADAPLSKKGLAALAAFADGGTLDAAQAKDLARLGVVTLGADGTPRLNADGKRLVAAAARGDARGVVDAAFAAGEKVGVGEAGETLPGWETLEDGSRAKKPKDAPKEAALAKGPAPEKPKKGGGGGGGGGGGKEPPKETAADDKDKTKAAERAARTAETAEAVGLPPGAVDALRAAAEGGAADPAQAAALTEAGLVEDDGDGGFITTDAGRRALGALARGDAAGYRAAVQDVAAGRKRKAVADTRRAEADGKRQQAAVVRDKAKADREKAKADKKKGTADQARAKLDDLADDFRRGRRGLSFDQQRQLVRAGMARLNGEQFELKTLALDLDLLELSL